MKKLIFAAIILASCTSEPEPAAEKFVQIIIGRHIDDDKYALVTLNERGDSIVNYVSYDQFINQKIGEELK